MALALCVLPTSTAEAQVSARPAVFDAHSSAVAARATVATGTLLPVGAPVDAGGHYATARAGSLGEVSSSAVLPYPGDLVLSGPGLAAGLLALDLPPVATTYPLGASSSHPVQPEQRVDLTAGSLAASASQFESRGTAATGADGATTAVADAATRAAEDGEVVATAATEIDALTIGPLTLGRLTSTATATARAGAAPVLEQRFDVGSAAVAGVPIRIDADGIHAGGSTSPLPGLDESIEAALAAAGVTVRLLPAEADAAAGRVRSAGVEVNVTETLADGIAGVVPPGQTVVTTLQFGVSEASAAASALPPLSRPAPPAPEGPAGAADQNPVVPLPPVPAAALLPTEPTQPARAGDTAVLAGANPAAFVDFDAIAFYPVLAAAGLACVAACVTLRTAPLRHRGLRHRLRGTR